MLGCPPRGLVRVAGIAGIRDLRIPSDGGMKRKVWLRTFTSPSVCAILGMWHAMHATAGAARFVMRVLFERGACGPVRRIGPVAVEAERLRGLRRCAVLSVPCDIVAGEARDAVCVHLAGHVVVALHAVLVGGAVGEMGEGGLAELVVFQLPKVAELCAMS